MCGFSGLFICPKLPIRQNTKHALSSLLLKKALPKGSRELNTRFYLTNAENTVYDGKREYILVLGLKSSFNYDKRPALKCGPFRLELFSLLTGRVDIPVNR